MSKLKGCSYALICMMGLLSLQTHCTFLPLNEPYLYNAFFSRRFQELRKPNLTNSNQGTATLSEQQKINLRAEAESNIAYHINMINNQTQFSGKQFFASILFGGLSDFLYHNSKYASSNGALTTAIILGGTITGCATNFLYNYIKRHNAFKTLTNAKNYIDQQGYVERVLNSDTDTTEARITPLNLRDIKDIAKDTNLLSLSTRFYTSSGTTLYIPALDSQT